MALFKKKERKEDLPRMPELPKLPELPEFPETDDFYDEEVPQLPSFQNNSLGNRFSQNTIKEAVTGKKEVEEVEANEFAGEEELEMRGMRRPLIKEETEREFFPKVEQKMIEAEPIFVRIDKFEEGSKEFGEVKNKIIEIEKMLADIEKIKEKEEKDLEFWKEEIFNIKEKIERVDKNIFSKLS